MGSDLTQRRRGANNGKCKTGSHENILPQSFAEFNAESRRVKTWLMTVQNEGDRCPKCAVLKTWNTEIQEYRFTTEDTEGTEEKTMVSEFMRLSRIHSLTTRSSLSLCSLWTLWWKKAVLRVLRALCGKNMAVLRFRLSLATPAVMPYNFRNLLLTNCGIAIIFNWSNWPLRHIVSNDQLQNNTDRI